MRLSPAEPAVQVSRYRRQSLSGCQSSDASGRLAALGPTGRQALGDNSGAALTHVRHGKSRHAVTNDEIERELQTLWKRLTPPPETDPTYKQVTAEMWWKFQHLENVPPEERLDVVIAFAASRWHYDNQQPAVPAGNVIAAEIVAAMHVALRYASDPDALAQSLSITVMEEDDDGEKTVH